MNDEQKILSFISATFLSVWTLEVLRFLAERHEQTFLPETLIVELRVSKSIIAKSIEQLELAALVLTNETGGVRFGPATRELEHLTRDALKLYERRPDQVRRTIVSRASTGLTAFSNAFRLRKN